MAAFLKVDGKSYPVLPDFGRPDFLIAQLQELVNSPNIMVLPARNLGKGIFIVAAEDGFERDRSFHPEASREASHALYGDVVIAKYEELGGIENGS